MLISTGPHHIIEPVTFQGGLDPHVYTPVSAHEPVIFQGGGVWTPYPPSGSAHEQKGSKTDRNSLNMRTD